MHHDHESKPAIRRHPGEKLLQNRDAAGGSAEPNDGRRLIWIAPLVRAVAGIRALLVGRRRIERLGGGDVFLRHEIARRFASGQREHTPATRRIL